MNGSDRDPKVATTIVGTNISSKALPQYARTGATAKHLGVSAKTLIRMVNARIVPVHKINGRLWLFRLGEVDAALDRFKQARRAV
jgi:excisionase family DNA binding protein